MEMNNYLPTSKVQKLNNKVCEKISCLKTNNWDRELKYAQQIDETTDKDYLHIVASEILKDKGRLILDKPRAYEAHALLLRLYILLYYKHSSEKLYSEYILPELLSYLNKDFFEWYNPAITELDKVLDAEKRVNLLLAANEQARPLFEIKGLSDANWDQLFKEYNRESLFIYYIEKIKDYSASHDMAPEEAHIWYHAKEFLNTIYKLDNPENYIGRIESSVHKYFSDYNYSNLIILCMYGMMKSIKDDHHFDKAIEKIESWQWKSIICKDEMENYIEQIANSIDNGKIVINYNYVSSTPNKVTVDDADGQLVQRLREEIESLKNTIDSLQDRNDKQKEEIDRLNNIIKSFETDPKLEDNKSVIDIKLDIKTKLEYLCLLFENSGVNFDEYGVKAKMSRLLQFFTGIDASTCNTYCSYRGYKYQRHEKEILEMNEYLASINCMALVTDKDTN